MNTLQYILDFYNLQDQKDQKIIEIPGTNRVTFAATLDDMNMNIGVEIGVEAGIYSEILLKSNPTLFLISIDAWTAYKGYRDHTSQSKMDELFRITKERLAPYRDRSEIVKSFSMDALPLIKDNSLDFVYIDGNHEFKQVVDDVCEWSKKVRPGGIVAGHDYIRRKDNGYLMHVVPAIHGYCDAYNIHPLFILGGKSDTSGVRDKVRSWFFVKPDPTAIKPGSGNKILT